MKKLFAVALMGIALILASCATSKLSTTAEGKKVAYKEARHYFLRNDATLPAEPLVTSQGAFEKLYAPAAVMGKDGQPTEIDFAKQMVVGVNLEATNDYKEIIPVSLTRHGKKLTLTYRIKYGERNMSWTMKPILLLVIDKQAGVDHCELVEAQN